MLCSRRAEISPGESKAILLLCSHCRQNPSLASKAKKCFACLGGIPTNPSKAKENALLALLPKHDSGEQSKKNALLSPRPISAQGEQSNLFALLSLLPNIPPWRAKQRKCFALASADFRSGRAKHFFCFARPAAKHPALASKAKKLLCSRCLEFREEQTNPANLT